MDVGPLRVGLMGLGIAEKEATGSGSAGASVLTATGSPADAAGTGSEWMGVPFGTRAGVALEAAFAIKLDVKTAELGAGSILLGSSEFVAKKSTAPVATPRAPAAATSCAGVRPWSHVLSHPGSCRRPTTRDTVTTSVSRGVEPSLKISVS